MALILICDNCGKRLSKGDASQVTVTSPKVPRGAGPNDVQAILQAARQYEQEDFYFCDECVLHLKIAIKQTQLMRKREFRPS